MQQVVDYPPNINDIRAVFPITGQEIFTWNDTIYNPSGAKLPQWLIAHESVHMQQQAEDPESWWTRYLVDPQWRFEQELEAHRAEFNVYCISPGALMNRNKKRAFLKALARRLSSPIYGRCATYQQCRMAIKRGPDGRRR